MPRRQAMSATCLVLALVTGLADSASAQAPPPPASPCPCPRSFLPVCGADGNTYSNACLAKCAGAAVAAEGECAAAPAAAKPAAAAPAKPAAAASAAAKPAAAPAPAKAPAKAAAAPPAGDWWRPSKDMAFQYQLINVFDPEAHFIPGVQVYVFDGFDNTADTVAALKAKGSKAAPVFAVCYISAGTFESWRPDAGLFLPTDLGEPLENWPGEKWLDISSDNVRAIIRKRMEMCKDKGFDAVDPDNVNGYTNPTGLGLTADEQLDFNTWLANTAHELGLGIALKNDIGQIAELDPLYDFYVNEMCQKYEECNAYAPAKAAGKAIFGIEYDPASFKAACKNQTRSGITPIFKNITLDSCRQDCDDKDLTCLGSDGKGTTAKGSSGAAHAAGSLLLLAACAALAWPLLLAA